MNPVDSEPYRKKTIVKLAIIFFGFMIFLTFFSKTINNLSLPRVKTEEPGNGALLREVSCEGIVEPKESYTVYPEAGRRVEKVRVRTGETVHKGQLLALLDAGDFTVPLNKVLASLPNMAALEGDLLALAANAIPGSELEGLDKEINFAKEQIKRTQDNLAIAGQLFEAGAETAENLKRARQSLADAQYTLELKETQRNRILKANFQFLKSVVLLAPGSGLVTTVNLKEGMMAETLQPAFMIANAALGFKFQVTVDTEKANYLSLGDTVDITFQGLNGKTLEGALEQIEDNFHEKGVKKDLVIALPPDPEISEGLRGDMYIAKKTKFYSVLVSNAAVGSDMNGDFVWVLKEKKGPLGEEFFVRSARVTVMDKDNFKTAVQGIEADDEVLIKWTKPLSDGCKVIPE